MMLPTLGRKFDSPLNADTPVLGRTCLEGGRGDVGGNAVELQRSDCVSPNSQPSVFTNVKLFSTGHLPLVPQHPVSCIYYLYAVLHIEGEIMLRTIWKVYVKVSWFSTSRIQSAFYPSPLCASCILLQEVNVEKVGHVLWKGRRYGCR